MIHLVRHGETAFNRDGLGLGRADVALTELGLAQAEAAGRRFTTVPVTRVVSSPLSRAMSVAEAICAPHGLLAEPIDSLTELDVGVTEGLTFVEMRSRFPDFLATWAGPEGWRAAMPGGESMEALAQRLAPLAAELLATDDREVVVVSHNFTLRALICLLLGVEIAQFRAFEIGLAAVTTLNVRNGRVAVRAMNDRCHLHGLNLS